MRTDSLRMAKAWERDMSLETVAPVSTPHVWIFYTNGDKTTHVGDFTGLRWSSAILLDFVRRNNPLMLLKAKKQCTVRSDSRRHDACSMTAQ